MAPIFHHKQHKKVAEILGSMSRVIPDQYIQTMTEEFGKVFEKDSWDFKFKEFQSIVTRHREAKDHEKN